MKLIKIEAVDAVSLMTRVNQKQIKYEFVEMQQILSIFGKNFFRAVTIPVKYLT